MMNWGQKQHGSQNTTPANMTPFKSLPQRPSQSYGYIFDIFMFGIDSLPVITAQAFCPRWRLVLGGSLSWVTDV